MPRPARAVFYPQQTITNYKSYRRYRKEVQEILGTEIRFSISALNALFGSQAAQVWEASSADSTNLGSEAAQCWESSSAALGVKQRG
jgi:hypothetical protein